ncbi:MAG: hydroxymethylpyrimidine/phosphomethylpyrimidine kinase [Pseudomonadota bacterium]
MRKIPIVLVFAGHDPSGGAGIQADIEALASQGCHAASVITALTVQDTTDVAGFRALEATDIVTQARAVLEDMPVALFKLGMLASVENVEVIHTILTDYPQIPVVLDPVLASGRGTALGGQELVEAIRVLLLPMTTVLTPNSLEARALAQGADTLEASALALLDEGVDYLLVTGSHENTPQVENRLYHDNRLLESFTWERLPHSYHGSGCTLASSLAGLLAHGLEPFSAIHEAQEFTWNALRHGYRPGLGQYLPDRFFWAGEDDR